MAEMDLNIANSGSVSPYANNGYTAPSIGVIGGSDNSAAVGGLNTSTVNTAYPQGTVLGVPPPTTTLAFINQQYEWGMLTKKQRDAAIGNFNAQDATYQTAIKNNSIIQSETQTAQQAAHANDFVGAATPGAIVKPPPPAGLMEPILAQPETPLGIRPVPAMGSDWNVKFKPDLSGLVGLLFPPKAPGQYTPTTAPAFTGLMAPKQNTQPLKGESQSFLPWQRQASLTPANADTSYLNDYRKDNFSLSKGYESQNEGLMLPTLDSYDMAKGQANVPTLDIDKQPAEKATGNYLKDYMKSNRDNLTKGVWQAYA